MVRGTSHSSIKPAQDTPHVTRWLGPINFRARLWMIVAVSVWIIATACYIPYSMHSEDGPHGGGWAGLAFGALATVAVCIPLLIPLRNRFKFLRFGKPAMWMQAHVYFGTISYPLAIYHAGGITWHGTLAQVLMWIFTGVILSGYFCYYLQRQLPTVTTLHSLTGDRRHAMKQRRTQMQLNAWLFIHVPLAYTMLVLVAIHSIMSVRFISPG